MEHHPVSQPWAGGHNPFGVAKRGMQRCGLRADWAAALLFIFVICLANTVAAAEADLDRKPAKLEVTGYGILGNRDLKRLLRLLDPKDAKREFYDSNFIQDALLILMSRVNRDGYLKVTVGARITLTEGGTVSYEWDRPLE